ncbi:F-type H+-transporting ATPase subunit gamma [Eubacterium uniforme]|uniref:ATP synthase gamma chain n=1 Tax=Eubacterium uniforme TaxID=39495 RepID=A0A1T4W0F4_9FIRM|nr:ATP synthase F1 subunit gamma [Eubacterium uniforme]SKA70703.1 F-type H+-transporting ATPase subunit gamma [Eubacterium uniforme]
MANAREIQGRIHSIQDTMKITKAMYMMSSIKLRKAKQNLENTEPYFESLQEQLSDIMLHYPDIEHLYFDNRPKDRAETYKKTAYVVITGDRGLAGAYNHNILKESVKIIEADDGPHRLLVVGELGRHFFRSQGYELEEGFEYSANNPSIHRARVIAEWIVELYKEEEVDRVVLIFTQMINSVSSGIRVEHLLPLKTSKFVTQEYIEQAKADQINSDWYTIYPSPKRALEKLVYNYVTGFMYGALVEGSASEENARMMAMKSATDNAEAMLSELSIEYNRVRQAAITQEITEVIGGAKALRNKKKKQAR